MGVTHLVAPSPQAKGKIERRFGTFQNRLLARLAYEQIIAYAPAQELLNRELARQNRTVCRTSGRSPDDACALAQAEGRIAGSACPDPSLLDLHLALQLGRRVNADQQIDFLGRSWPISATARKTVTIIHHPHLQFWVVSQPPQTTAKPLARHPRKILPLTQSHFAPATSLILNARRQSVENDLHHRPCGDIVRRV